MAFINNAKRRIIFLILIVSSCVCTVLAGVTYNASASKDQSLTITQANKVVLLSGRQHFSVYFNMSLGTENAVEIEKIATVTDNVLINGKSVTEINAEGKNLFGDPIKNGVTLNVWANSDYTNYGLHFFINDSLSVNYKLKLDDTDVVTFKNGFSLNGVTFDSEVSTNYYHSVTDWKNDGDLIDKESAVIEKVSAPVYYAEQELYYFYVKFKNNPSDKFIMMADYDRIMDNISYCGLTFNQLNSRYGADSAYVRFQTGTSMQLPYEDYLMYLHLSKRVTDALGLNDQTTLTFAKDLRLPSLADLGKDASFEYDLQENFWVTEIDSTVNYHEIAPVEISAGVFDSSSGNYYVVLYFDKSVSMHYMPQVNAKTDWLEAVYNIDNPIFYYSNSHLQALIYDNVRSSILDYLYINGESVRALQEKETKVQKDQSICINYCGAQFNPRAIQILFNKDGVNAYNPDQTYTLEIKQGFSSPMHGKTQRDYAMVVGKGLVDSVEKGGCNGSIAGVESAFLPAFLGLALVIRRRKNVSK